MSSLDDAMQECTTNTGVVGVHIVPPDCRLAIFNLPYRGLRPLMGGKAVRMSISELLNGDTVSIQDVRHEQLRLGYARLEVVD